MDKNWYYYLLEADGRSLFVDARGRVGGTPAPTALEYSPEGWDDIAIGHDRDMKKRIGLVRSFTFPLRFTMDGAKILRQKLYNEGIESKVYLLITYNKVDFSVPGEYRDYHTVFFRGEIDFSTMKDQDQHVSVEVRETGLAKAIAANADTKYEFPLNGAGSITVNHDGMLLAETHNFLVTQQHLTEHTHLVGAGMSSSEGKAVGLASFQVFWGNASGLNTVTSEDHLFTSLTDIRGARISGKVRVRAIIDNSLTYKLYFLTSLGRRLELATKTVSYTQWSDVTFDLTFNISAEEKFFLIGEDSGGFKGVEYEESEFKIEFAGRYKPTMVRAYLPETLLDLLLEKVYGKRGAYVSTLLSASAYKWLAITSGDGIRSLPNAVIKISLNELLDIIRALMRGGVGIEKNKLVVEDIFDYFLNPTAPVIDFGEAKSCTIGLATEVMGNKIKVGHKTASIDEVNGKYAVNTVFNYSTPATRVAAEIDIMSPAIADPYIIEHLRINFDGKKTTDNSKDNDLIVLHVDSASATVQKEVAGKTSVQGLFGGGSVVFDTFDGGLFEANSDRSAFTYRGTEGTSVSITGTCYPLVGDGGDTTLNILKGLDVIASTLVVVANGTNLGTVTAMFHVEPGDVVALNLRQSENKNIVISQAAFEIAISGRQQYNLFRATYSSITGVPAGNSIFNIELLTPHRMMRLWHRWFNSIYWRGLEGLPLKLETAERNKDLVTVRNGVTTREADDILISNVLGFKPYKFTIETLVPADIVVRLYENPNQQIRFAYGDYRYKGFLLKGGITPDDNREQVYELLCTPDTDESTLINR